MSHFGGDKVPELTPCQEDAVFETDANSTHNAECWGFQSLTSQGCSQVPQMASTPEGGRRRSLQQVCGGAQRAVSGINLHTETTLRRAAKAPKDRALHTRTDSAKFSPQ